MNNEEVQEKRLNKPHLDELMTSYNPIKDKSYDLNNKENRGRLCDLANIIYPDTLNRGEDMSYKLDLLNNNLLNLESLLGVKYE